MPRELPIIFCADMVKAILEGRKTQMRRLIVPQPQEMRPLGPHGCPWPYKRGKEISDIPGVPVWEPIEPRYQVGDELWVKEPHYLYGEWIMNGRTKNGLQKLRFVYDRSKGVKYPDDPPKIVCTKKYQVGWFKRTARFMPKWAARLWLRVTAVKDPNQVQTISEEDAIAEGIQLEACYSRCPDETFQRPFRELWDRLHPKPGERWEDHPWVFGYEFKRLERYAT